MKLKSNGTRTGTIKSPSAQCCLVNGCITAMTSKIGSDRNHSHGGSKTSNPSPGPSLRG